ncbi:hypothetical protein PILCRDRAFT_819859 [Piloderma croceum F 1598]|uniref:Uncharacterized protein n=1 Tax=Piloderma croceum (strain F 1598) TaxID=765440 RepID=A0A0C3FWW0_PILCF|nr:hypothetical protein PILCRDRAFT_819859 [Piloderma croceum F 1598]
MESYLAGYKTQAQLTTHVDKVLSIFQLLSASSIMQFFKSIVISILVLSAYATASTHSDCQKLTDSCEPDIEPCCPGLTCNEEDLVCVPTV